MGEELFDVCECEEFPAEDENPDPELRIGDVEILPVEACRDKSEGVLLLPDIVGMPIRSANGWPNANQSFSTRAYKKDNEKLKLHYCNIFASCSEDNQQLNSTNIMICQNSSQLAYTKQSKSI